MKKILVPTDFSKVANNALKYAIAIAGEFKAELYLYHVYHMNKFDLSFDFPEDDQPFSKQVELQMKLTKLKFMDDIMQKGLVVHTIVDQDSIHSLFKSKVKSLEIDLIVMGSKGATGLERVVFGSVAATVMEMASVPVLFAPPGYGFRKIAHVTLAVDRHEVRPGTLLPLRKLTSRYGAKVTTLNVKEDSDTEAPEMIVLDGLETTYREVPVSGSINETINVFMEEENCDLLCMIIREKGFLASIFKKSITKAQIYNRQSPLLALPESVDT